MNHSGNSSPNYSPNYSPSSPSSPSLLMPPQLKPRKYSLPLIHPRQSPSDYLESTLREARGSTPSSHSDPFTFTSQKKRLSQVGIAVSQHLSATIGWKILASHSQIVQQAKCLCARFIRFKLRKCGLHHKRLNLQRLRSMCSITFDPVTNQVETEIKYLTLELERMHPKIYSSVLNNINSNQCTTSMSVESVLQTIAQELFRNDITWARIAALYAVVGALAVDLVHVGHTEFIINVIENFTAFVERDLAAWIAQQGGWDSLIYRFRREDYWRKSLKFMLLSISILFWAILAYFLM